MKSMLMAVMAVAVAVTFSAPAFAEGKKEEKKGGHVVMADKPKEEKKGGHADTFGEKPKEEKKGGHADTFGDKKEEHKGK